MTRLYVPPVGSPSFGNKSVPQIDHAAAAVTMPAKAKTAFYIDRNVGEIPRTLMVNQNLLWSLELCLKEWAS